ncbi:hypothetical protein AB0F91_33560 [Amycolatopsis sp. NPDC023774]|uniref:hypothetical protein n=1 Tax=Amycolatopsis sp. NPDC023774 TaxID=3155015 RepID=UPI003408BE10
MRACRSHVWRRSACPPRGAFAAGAATLAALYVGNNPPSALYALLRTTFGFSALIQTLLYAVAVAVIVPALLVWPGRCPTPSGAGC